MPILWTDEDMRSKPRCCVCKRDRVRLSRLLAKDPDLPLTICIDCLRIHREVSLLLSRLDVRRALKLSEKPATQTKHLKA